MNYVRQKLILSVSKDGQRDGFDGILICIHQSTKTITYSAANNKPILVIDNKIQELAFDRMPVGSGEKKDPFHCYTIEYVPNAMLYLYTDGYADQFGGPKGKKFKYKQLNDHLLSNHKKSVIEQEALLSSNFESWKGQLEQVDDVCVVGIRL
jgi:serine phosphatase RsbU (regulator of sigma subunit)